MLWQNGATGLGPMVYHGGLSNTLLHGVYRLAGYKNYLVSVISVVKSSSHTTGTIAIAIR